MCEEKCAKNNTHIHVAQTSIHRVIASAGLTIKQIRHVP